MGLKPFKISMIMSVSKASNICELILFILHNTSHSPIFLLLNNNNSKLILTDFDIPGSHRWEAETEVENGIRKLSTQGPSDLEPQI